MFDFFGGGATGYQRELANYQIQFAVGVINLYIIHAPPDCRLTLIQRR